MPDHPDTLPKITLEQAQAEGLTKRLAEGLRAAINAVSEAEVLLAIGELNRGGLILAALAGHFPGYRKDIDDIHAALAEFDLPESRS